MKIGKVLDELGKRFHGIDLQCRDDWRWGHGGRWRARTIINSDEGDAYRLTVFGATSEEALRNLTNQVNKLDEANESFG
ncbi:hypothetical protein MLD52_09095 [Puniceicoccaceae bacterium K14]|nr:hypothetical protein [Puniceicoccaceae bacterium K14]